MTVTSRSGASVLRMRATVPPPAPPPTMTTLARPWARAGRPMRPEPAEASAAAPSSRPNSLRSIMSWCLVAGPSLPLSYARPGTSGNLPFVEKLSVQRGNDHRMLDRRTFLLRAGAAAALLGVLHRVPGAHAEPSAAESAEFKAALEALIGKGDPARQRPDTRPPRSRRQRRLRARRAHRSTAR